jgi:hypothetical protein
MKKLILAVTTLALAGTSVQTAKAHDGWSTAGKVLTGLVAARVVADIVAPHTYVYEPAPVYAYQPQVVYAPAPAPVVVAPVATVPCAPTVAPAPTVVYQQAPQVVYQPAPVVVQPAPVVVYRPAPVYCAPPVYYRPGVSIGLSFGGGYHHHGRW